MSFPQHLLKYSFYLWLSHCQISCCFPQAVILVPAEKGELSPLGFSFPIITMLASQQPRLPSLVPSLRAPWVFPGLILHSLFGDGNVSVVPIALFVWLPSTSVCSLTGTWEALLAVVQRFDPISQKHPAHFSPPCPNSLAYNV